MGEVDKEGELHAKQRAEWLAEEAEEESSHPDYENHSIPIEEVDKELDEQDLQMRDTPNEEISLFTPHITFPVNYPTVEQIERITKAKAEMEQIKAKEDDVRHHAWE